MLAYLLGFVALAYALVSWHTNRRRRYGTLPPGPKGLPILGNVTDFSGIKEPWRAAAEWHKKYGDICYLHVLGQGIVFLNSHEVAFDLLEKRGVIYSDRQRMVMAAEVCGLTMVPFTRYGDSYRLLRKLMQRALGAPSVRTYHPFIEIETHALLHRLLSEPENFERHFIRFAGTMTLSVIYGHRVSSDDDKFLVQAEHCMEVISNEIVGMPPSGIWAVDVFPFLKDLPDWVPFTSFKQKARKWKAEMEEFVEEPYAEVKKKMKEGSVAPSFCSTLLQQEKEIDPDTEHAIKWSANSMFGASIDTTNTLLCHLILLMLQYPEKFAKARREIDTVVRGRLPTFADRPSLPYIECVMSELFRVACPVPLNLPHKLMEDDLYNGLHLPKGSIIIANIMAMLRNEELFPNPEEFIPERYEVEVDEATARAMDPRQAIFGFGRRRCPGIFLVESTAWLVLVSIIATIDVTKAVDVHGNEIEPKVTFDNMVFRSPSKFPANFKPRSEEVATLIKQVVDADCHR